MSSRVTAILVFAFWCWGSFSQCAFSQLTFEMPPISYSQSQPQDPIAKLMAEIDRGEAALVADAKTGYLASLLKELQVPVSSQTLVFSKTSLQRHKISPSNPRAIFFNDETYIGWVPSAELIEIASIDPVLGANFYTIDQDQVGKPCRINRRTDRCLFCHASSDTGRVPGLMMQSIYSDSDGHRVFPAQSIRPRANGPLHGRWAGWFVSGTHGKQQHLGNLTIDSDERALIGKQTANANVKDLAKWFDVDRYLSPHSDLVALLVLQHQVTTHNMLIDANHRARRVIHEAVTHKQDQHRESLSDEDRVVLDQIASEVVDGLLMVGQVTFTEAVAGTSSFARGFSKVGPHDSAGRSLRDLDLHEALFRYPCSYLIYSDSFDALPAALMTQVKVRLHNVLLSKDKREKFGHLTTEKRKVILGILRETKPEFIVEAGRPAE